MAGYQNLFGGDTLATVIAKNRVTIFPFPATLYDKYVSEYSSPEEAFVIK
jgi:hypothetical protein